MDKEEEPITITIEAPTAHAGAKTIKLAEEKT
jgi:hypothetical protein